ncbi:MAG: hypothetical protein DRN35_00700 [Thermoplasmata archaeon]|nr:MAG: hypothetical protein DRN28_06800 [Thermoplasmata archaeon]RLF72404.1 MAG: hypothetical protein DRN35_00700 [Thermoplasmata archaeon]RLF75401.1 MAG: hypothetical protein DRN42_02940 [Thermoplasmata archaeon]HDD59957.1 glycosyltransferase family 2 protein [Euryarchaeota archaeon]
MRWYKALSLLIAAAIITPLVVLPAHAGISISGGSLRVTVQGSVSPEGGFGILYTALNLYYILFIILGVGPFLFFLLWSAFVRRAQRKKKGRPIGDSFTPLTKRYPKVSIIIPCYNESRHVGRAVNSSYRQNYPGEIEIIVVDDGSRDNTWSIARIFEVSDKKRSVKVIHKENGGKASALRVGIKHATGEIIVMTDGDGQIDPHAVSEIVRIFREHPDAGVVGGFVSIKNHSKNYLTKLQQMEYIITQHVIRIAQSDSGSVLIAPGPIFGMRAELARQFPPLERTVVEDCDLTMSVLSAGVTTRSTINALSYTDAPESWKAWIRQRKRWIYGQFQAWRENRWHLKSNPWGVYTYFTWVFTAVSALIFLGTMLLTLFFLSQGTHFYSFLEFLSLRTVIITGIYLTSRAAILISYPQTRRLLHYLPLKIFYDIIAGFLTAYLYLRYITGLGVRLNWGTRNEVIY